MRCHLPPNAFIRTALIFAGLLAWLIAPHAIAQTNIVDPIFGGPSLGLAGNVYSLAMQSDGKLIVAGGNAGLARLNTDGSTDTSFSPPSLSYPPATVTVQNDDKILVSGFVNSSDDESIVGDFFRLNSDGSLDSSFTPSDDGPQTIALQAADGKILLGGGTDYYENSPTSVTLQRLNSDGTPDTSFQVTIANPDGDSAINCLAVQGDAKIVIGGKFARVNGVARRNIARLNPDGTLDTTYVVDSVKEIYGGGLQPGDLLVVSGTFTGSTASIVRFNLDGTLDPRFYYDGSVTPESSLDLFAVSSTGIVVFGGIDDDSSDLYDLVSLNHDGSVNPGFNATLNFSLSSLIVDHDGTVVLGGSFINHVNGAPCNSVAELNADGSTNVNFAADIAPGPNNRVFASVVQPDHATIIAGSFTAIGTAEHEGIARLKDDGTVDPTFDANIDDGSLDATVSALALQVDGKVLFAGFFYTVDGTNEYSSLIRLNADGSLDGSFNSNRDTSEDVAIVLQTDGKILVGGYGDASAAPEDAALARFNPDGSLDTAFTAAVFQSSDDYDISALALQADMRILAGGYVNSNDTQMGFLYRLNSDGSVDPTFNLDAGVSGSQVQSIAIQPDGKILVAFYAVSANSSGCHLVRLNTDGSLDDSFNTTLDGGSVTTVLVQADGTIVIGGNFSQVNGEARMGLAHLLADGSLNPFLPQETGVSGNVQNAGSLQTMALDPDGKVVLGGNFTSVDGTPRNYMARLSSSGTPNFFEGNVSVGNGFSYLQFPDGTPFGYYNLAGNGYAFPYFYHADLGMEYFFDANDGQGGAYLYDFTSGGFFYTSSGANLPFPYLYDFTFNSVLYYYPDPNNLGHYTTNPRSFYDFASSQIITR